MSIYKMTRSARMRDDPLNSLTPKLEVSPRKSANQIKNTLFGSDRIKPSSTLSLNLGNDEQKMTQIPAKKSTVSQGTPLVKKKNLRRSSRSRSRNRYSRRSTPPRSLTSQIVKTDSVDKVLPNTVRRSVGNVVKENSVPPENHSL
ncbi:unnamed protein product, partial [Acanthocheilonema viteae]